MAVKCCCTAQKTERNEGTIEAIVIVSSFGKTCYTHSLQCTALVRAERKEELHVNWAEISSEKLQKHTVAWSEQKIFNRIRYAFFTSNNFLRFFFHITFQFDDKVKRATNRTIEKIFLRESITPELLTDARDWRGVREREGCCWVESGWMAKREKRVIYPDNERMRRTEK